MSELKITSANFEQEVLKSDKPVLLDFWATWCRPCQMIGPEISKIADEHPEIKVGKVNVDEEFVLANSFKVNSIPMLAVMKDGKLVRTSVGYKSKEQIEAMLR